MTLGTALLVAADAILRTGEKGSVSAARVLRAMSGEPEFRHSITFRGHVHSAALRVAAAELRRSGHAAMSLLCAQLADEHGPL